jgi:hypothetical protein
MHCIQADDHKILHGHQKMADDLITLNFTLTISKKLLFICVTYDDEPMQSDVLSLICVTGYWYSSALKDLTASKFWGMMTVR